MNEFENNEEEQKTKRPLRLTVLCIMTFIFSGLGAISSLLTPFLSDVMVSFIKSSPNYVEADYAENLKVIQAGWAYHLPTFIFAIGSLTGAILMWKLKKAGFHFYAFSNLALLFIPTLVLHLTIGWSAIFVTIGFIGMYGLNLRSMK